MFDPKKYTRDFLGAMTFYTVAVIASVSLLKRFDFSGIGKILIALLPVLPAILATLVVLYHFRKLDEMQMRIQVEAFSAAALITGLVSFSLGFAQNAGLPQISLTWVFPGMIALWGLFLLLVRKRYIGK